MVKDKKEETNAIKFPEKYQNNASNVVVDDPEEEEVIEEVEEKSYDYSSGPTALSVIIGLGSVAIALMLIIIVVGTTESMVPEITDPGVVDTTMNKTISHISESFSILQLAPIVLIVIVAGIVIGILAVFSRS